MLLNLGLMWWEVRINQWFLAVFAGTKLAVQHGFVLNAANFISDYSESFGW